MYVPMSPPPVLTSTASNSSSHSTSLHVGDSPLSTSIFDRYSAAAKRYKYLRRLLKFRQMDFEFAIWQVVHLFIAPQKVFRAFQYRKRKRQIFQSSQWNLFCFVLETKNQWARDDPAFLVLLMIFLIGKFSKNFRIRLIFSLIFISFVSCHRSCSSYRILWHHQDRSLGGFSRLYSGWYFYIDNLLVGYSLEIEQNEEFNFIF